MFSCGIYFSVLKFGLQVEIILNVNCDYAMATNDFNGIMIDIYLFNINFNIQR